MKYLNATERKELAGEYVSPEGLYDYIKSLPFLGKVSSSANTFVAGEWTEIVIHYEVGGSGLADGAWIKGAFKFYSDWALFQTSDRTKDNYVSAEYLPHALHPGQTVATVQTLSVRFDQKGHERPFQKAVIVDIGDGYLNPGDQIVIRLGDRRWGARGTRAQTFVEKDFKWRFYVDPIGTSKFAPVQPDLAWKIQPGALNRLQVSSPRLVRPQVAFYIRSHAEDVWGNVLIDIPNQAMDLMIIQNNEIVESRTTQLPAKGWSHAEFENISLPCAGNYIIETRLKDAAGSLLAMASCPLTVSGSSIVPKALFGDLHVHSDDTVGTGDSVYNFSYGRHIAGLDVLGYTANDFQITKARWDATVKLIQNMNEPGSFVLFPGTEWCGNSAAGGDHNVVFLADPSLHPPEFPFDRNGNVARSFEWSEDGPADLVAGAWPLDEVYATYARDADTHLLIPHVGGRRCNLSWHHPKLERLAEIGSAWGHFEWLLQDALQRGLKLGVSANSDEHRGRCGGGVPGTAVFGTKGGLTGILAASLDRETIAGALRSRHTFATTGTRLVGIIADKNGHIQGDEFELSASEPLELRYHFLGNGGFMAIRAFDKTGCIWERNLWHEINRPRTILRVSWGGARLYDRYREAVWSGTIKISGNASIKHFQSFGGFSHNPEDQIEQLSPNTLGFCSRTSGDMDGIHLSLNGELPDTISVEGALGGYVKVGDPLLGNPHKPQPKFEITASRQEYMATGGKKIVITGGVELFVAVEAIPDGALPTELSGTVAFSGVKDQKRAIYFAGVEWNGEKVISSPVFPHFI